MFLKPITMEEVQYSIRKLKYGKASGIDMICNEILKQPHFCVFLKTCFNRGVTHTLWVKSIVNLIPNYLSNVYLPL